MPDAVPEPGAQPAVDLLKFDLDTCHSEVIKPTPLDLFDLLDALVKGTGCGFAGDSFQTLFESLPSLFCHHQLVLAFVALAVGGHEPVTQNLEVYRSSDAALFLVDRQLESLVQKAVDAFAYPLGFRFAPGIGAEVIGIADDVELRLPALGRRVLQRFEPSGNQWRQL